MNELADQFGATLRPPSTGEVGAALGALVDMISDGGLRPGDRLPPEREMATRLGVSRTNLRKALDRLEQDGAIWRHVGKGTFVATGMAGPMQSRLPDLARSVTPMQMMRARLSLEPAIAAEAAIHATASTVARLAAGQETAVAAESWDDYEAADDALHRAIAEATGNALLLALFDHLNEVRRAVAWSTVVRRSERPPRTHTSFAEHQAIVAAIGARSAVDARAAMRAHLASVAARLFGDT